MGTIDSYYAGAKAGTITETTLLDPYIAWRNLYARAKEPLHLAIYLLVQACQRLWLV